MRGGECRVAFDTPLVANRIGAEFDSVDLVILGHVHEDHMAGLHRLPGVPVHVHPADLDAARSWDGLARHFGYRDEVLAGMQTRLEQDFFYQARPDAIAYYGDATSNLADFRRTLAEVARLDARAWVTSHHRGVITDRDFFLASLAAFTGKLDERRDRLLAMLAAGPLSLDSLVQQRLLYPPEYEAPSVDCIERRTIRMHLDELLADSSVRQLDDGRYLAG